MTALSDGHINIFAVTILLQRYIDSVDNTVEENSRVFSLIRMRWLSSARERRHQQNPPVLSGGSRHGLGWA